MRSRRDPSSVTCRDHRAGVASRSVLAAIALTCACAVGCETPFLAKNDPAGQFVFGQGHGAAVITANGVEFRDREEVPQRVVVRDPDAAWHAPIGFILPSNGLLTHTSSPVVVASQGIVIVVRSSDTRVPSWGGEILLRVDVHAVGNTARDPEQVAVVVDSDLVDSDLSSVAVSAALSQLGADDRITVIDTHGPRTVVPTMPATHRSLALAATTQRLRATLPAQRDLPRAIALAREAVGTSGPRRILLLTPDAITPPVKAQITLATSKGIDVGAVRQGDDDAVAQVQSFLPAAGAISFRNLVLHLASSPSPSHILEATAGDPAWLLEGSSLALGDVHAGEARAEVLRVTVPAWSPGSTWKLRIGATVFDVSNGIDRRFDAELAATYDDDIERIAESRAGDVIAYASALATLDQLHAAFVGDSIERLGIRSIATMQAKSLMDLSRDFSDRGFAEDAAILDALLRATAAP